MVNIYNHRDFLTRTWGKLKMGKITIGFIGGSITDPRPRYNWPEPVIAWFQENFPQTKILVENAAIGATGSDLATLRAQRDLIDRNCDIVFIDYAVNDIKMTTKDRKRTREGLIRKLLADNKRDLVLVYTFCQDMYSTMVAGETPASIEELELLANHYGIGSVWMGLHALQEVQKGKMRWEEWLPDGLHPTSRGSLSYAESVIEYLEVEKSRFVDKAFTSKRYSALANPLDNRHWQATYILSLEDINTVGPWTIRRWPFYEWIDRVLETAAVGAKMSFSFEGRGVALGFDFGKLSSEFCYRIDQGPWITEHRERPDWAGNDGWYRLSVLTDDLDLGCHNVELEVIHGDRAECQGTNFRLGLVGIIG